jgi:hypothetical protein
VTRTSIPPRGIPNSFAPPLDFTVSSISVTTLVLVTFANVFTGTLAGFFCALYFFEVNLFVTSGNAIRGVIRDSTKPVANESMTSEMRKKSRQLIEGLIALGWLPQAVSTMSTCTFRIQDARWNVDRSVPPCCCTTSESQNSKSRISVRKCLDDLGEVRIFGLPYAGTGSP